MKLSAIIFSSTLTMLHAAELTEIPFNTIEGKETSLSDFKDKVVLIVNTASKCGFTSQYEGLEKLQDTYGAKGFTVIAFPCNDFGKQEPGSAEEIQEFCKTRFDVSFPLMEKIHVKGKEQHPLYAALTGKEAAFPGGVKWNFGKFLIGKDGKPIARYGSRTKPADKALVAAIETGLGG